MDIERSLLSLLCAGGAKNEVFQYGVRPKMFLRWKREFVWLMESFRKHGAYPSKVAFKRQFPEFEFVKTKNPGSYYCEQLLQRSLYNGMCDLVEQVQEALEGPGKEDPQKAWETLTKSLSVIASNTRAGSVRELGEEGPLRWKMYQDRKQSQGVLGYLTGWKPLDDMMGGLQNGHLILLAGVRFVAKTWLSCYLATEVWKQGGRPLFFSLEMPTVEVTRRMDALLCKLPYENLRRGRLTKLQELRYHRWLQGKRDRPFTVSGMDESGDRSVLGIVSRVKELHPTALFIDAAHLIADDSGAKSRVERIYVLCEQLKNAAHSLDIPLIANTHINRGKEGMDALSWGDSWARCVPGNSLIDTVDGLVYIRDMENKSAKVVCQGQTKSARVFHSGMRRTLCLNAGGVWFTCSPEHKVRVWDDVSERFLWKEAGTVKKGRDWLLYRTGGYRGKNTTLPLVESKPRRNPIVLPTSLSRELGWLLGAILGDGHIGLERGGVAGGSVSLACGLSSETRYANKFLHYMRKVFAATGSIHTQRPRGYANQIIAYVAGSQLSEWWYKLLKPAHKKVLPEFILTTPRWFRLACLEGLVESDGHVNKYRQISFSVGKDNPELIRDVQRLCLSLGIFGVISRCTRRGVLTHYNLKMSVVDTRELQLRLVSRLKNKRIAVLMLSMNDFSTPINLARLVAVDYVKRTGFRYRSRVLDRKSQRVSYLLRKAMHWKGLGHDSLYKFKPEFRGTRFLPVIDVSEQPSQPMWDISIHDNADKSVVCDGFIVHNSSDEIIEIRGEPQSKVRALILEKQREGPLGECLIKFDLDAMDLSACGGAADAEVEIEVE